MPDHATTSSTPATRPDDSLSSAAWADGSPTPGSPGFHDALTANTPATGGDAGLTEFGSGIGGVIGKFKISKPLGTGGNGRVFAAVHQELGKTVALKFFKAYAAAPHQLDAMRREAQTLASLRHPGIVSVDDFQVYEPPRAASGSSPSSPQVQVPFIVMEYIPSEMTLGQWARTASPSIPELLRMGAEMCDAVDHAHERGIIHRDLKPGNVLVDVGPDNTPRPRVIDFGLSQLLAGWGSGPTRGEFDRVTGTLQYMSPEQLSGNPGLVDRRSDVYALGVVLYELLCGRLPYTARAHLTGELKHEIREGLPVRPSEIKPELKGAIEDVLLRALDKDPNKRHQRAADLADDLRRILADDPLPWRSEPVVERAARTSRNLSGWAKALVVVGAALAALFGAAGIWMAGAWRPMSSGFERLAALFAAPTVQSIDHVRVIEMRDGLDPEAVAKDIHVAGVANDDPRSLRRLHGRLMERLATAGASTVVFDLHFPKESTHDEAFAKGVAALHSAGIDAVIGVKVVRADALAPGTPGAAETSEPAIAPTIRASGVRWGYVQVNALAGRPITIPLVTRQGAQGFIPSLTISAIAASRWPRTRVEFEAFEDAPQGSVLRTAPMLFMRCFADGAGPGAPTRPVASAEFEVSALGPWEDYQALGFSSSDDGAMWTVQPPPREAFEPATCDYAQVLRMSDDELARWATGKIILIGDCRAASGDLYDFADYTRAPAVYTHATGIEALSRNVALRYPTVDQVVWTALLGAILGGALGFVLWGRPRTQVLVAVAAALGATVAAVLLYATAGIVANPFVVVTALLIAMALTAGLGRLASRGDIALRSGSPA